MLNQDLYCLKETEYDLLQDERRGTLIRKLNTTMLLAAMFCISIECSEFSYTEYEKVIMQHPFPSFYPFPYEEDHTQIIFKIKFNKFIFN